MNRILKFILGLIQPDLNTIVGTFTKAEKALEKLIARETDALERETIAIEALRASRSSRNMTIDRSYRVLNNINQLTA